MAPEPGSGSVSLAICSYQLLRRTIAFSARTSVAGSPATETLNVYSHLWPESDGVDAGGGRRGAASEDDGHRPDWLGVLQMFAYSVVLVDGDRVVLTTG